MRKLLLTASVGALLGYAAGCRVQFDDSALVFKCSNDGECGGGGYVCVGGKYCCKPEGSEAENGCDGRDNDCNGIIDEAFGTADPCNGLDDDCDNRIDEDTDLIQDPRNCGACGRTCTSNQACMNAVCVTRGETSCTDRADNDTDNLIDCADPDCNLQGCGTGCQCRALAKAEGNCNDGADNDEDSKVDCADPDCEGAGCGTGGCTCSNLTKREVDCRDTMDNDGDGMSDCADSDCPGQLCQAEPSSFRCTAGGACACNDGGVTTETAARCRDGVDNDCNGKVDCAEVSCDGVSCAPDAGASCVCSGGTSKEANCADRRDNDNDGATDCADALPDGGGDCPRNTPCTYLNPGGMVRSGTCAADRTCK